MYLQFYSYITGNEFRSNRATNDECELEEIGNIKLITTHLIITRFITFFYTCIKIIFNFHRILGHWPACSCMRVLWSKVMVRRTVR